MVDPALQMLYYSSIYLNVKILHVKVKFVTHDVIDNFVTEWATEWPDLDASHLETIGRIWRISEHLRRSFEKGLKPHGLTWESFDVIVSLRRSGEPYRMRPTDLSAVCLLTSGAMTNRLDRVERAGLIARSPDPNDSRAIQVELTPKGVALVDQVIQTQFSAARRLLECLSAQEQALLAPLLRTILVTFEPAANLPLAGSVAEAAPRGRKRRIAQTSAS